jgi:hypothetical protein
LANEPSHPHWGSSLNEFLAEQGLLDVVEAEALARVEALKLSQEIKVPANSNTTQATQDNG